MQLQELIVEHIMVLVEVELQELQEALEQAEFLEKLQLMQQE